MNFSSIIRGGYFVKNIAFLAIFAFSAQAYAISESLLNLEKNPKEVFEKSKKSLEAPNLTADEKAFLLLDFILLINA